MALPQNSLSSSTVMSPLLYPDNIIRSTELEDFELGGIALQDPSQGLMVQSWRGAIDPVSLNCTLAPFEIGSPTVVFTETIPAPIEFSFSFDSNMRYMAVTRWADNTVKMRWYDTAIPGYTITTYTGIKSMMLTLDDKRPVADTYRDVLFTYIKADNKLYYRQQRDRFLIERVLDPDLRDNLRITQFGMGKNLRMQWRLEYRRAF